MGKSKNPESESEDERRSLVVSSNLLEVCSRQVPTALPSLWKEHVEIRQLLDEIRLFQVVPCTPAFDADLGASEGRARYLEEFQVWCRSVGVDPIGVGVKRFEDYGGGYGLVCVRALQAGETFLAIPRKAMLSLDHARKSVELADAIASDPLLNGMSNVALSLFILSEKFRGLNSFWHPYLAFLPASYTTALYFTAEEIDLLRGSPAFDETLKMFRNIARQFAYFHQLIGMDKGVLAPTPFTIHNFTFDAYKWAVSSVMTRINLIPSSEDNSWMIPALIPFLDLANHRIGPPATDFDEESQCALCRSTCSYGEGEQVFIFYGARNNADFLLHDGFVYSQDRSHDYVRVKLGLSKTDKLLPQRSSLLEIVLKLRPNECFDVGRGSEPIPAEMVDFVRVFVASEESIEEALKTRSLSCLLEEKDAESKVWNFIRTRLQLLHKSYRPICAGVKENYSVRAKMAAELVAMEKMILTHAIQYAESKLAQ